MSKENLRCMTISSDNPKRLRVLNRKYAQEQHELSDGML